ncbi:MAG: UbiH/UbiF/VisC/COQ6 family ubiquinone biosynthesis hydroxylase [Leucothrix sp.]
MSGQAKMFDAVIVGAGIVGATLAALLGREGKRIALVEARTPTIFDIDAPFDLRVSAINRASQLAFQGVGAWEAMLAKRAHAYDAMCVWDEAGTGEIRFEANEVGLPSLGHIIENKAIQASLLEAVDSYETVSVLCPSRVVSVDAAQKQVITLDSGEQLIAPLLVGADGPSSMVRALAGIDQSREDYGQKGLVTVIKTEYGHQDTAWQRFLASGPLALLPLHSGYSSIVWSLPSDQADRYLKTPIAEFCRLLSEASAHRLGAVLEVGERAAFPLLGSQASAYIRSGVALVGDAAHTIHPLAGQGVNLGIKDAVVLAEVLSTLSPRDWGSYKQLRRYERARQGENVLAMKAMEGFSVLFGHNAQLVKLARNTGLNVFNSMPRVKQQIMQHAMG